MVEKSTTSLINAKLFMNYNISPPLVHRRSVRLTDLGCLYLHLYRKLGVASRYDDVVDSYQPLKLTTVDFIPSALAGKAKRIRRFCFIEESDTVPAAHVQEKDLKLPLKISLGFYFMSAGTYGYEGSHSAGLLKKTVISQTEPFRLLTHDLMKR